MSRKTVAESKARLEAEIRGIVREMRGRPADEIAAEIRRRTNAAVDADFLADLISGRK